MLKRTVKVFTFETDLLIYLFVATFLRAYAQNVLEKNHPMLGSNLHLS